jgi:formate dehydrogenase gamma subunit
MNKNRTYPRFSVSDRIEHWLLTLSFTTLAVTGLVQKFSDGLFAQWVIQTLGGVENVRVIHRAAAVIMMLEAVYHLGVVGYRLFILRHRLTMLPSLDDARAAVHALLYNVGLREAHPQQGRYTFEEKAEYWALIWGTLIMSLTGFMLWNPIATTKILPGEWIPAAKAAHGAEAVLAASAIIVWHLYGVHVKRFNKSMFTGQLGEEEMLDEHPLELAELKAGAARRPQAPLALARRRRAYLLGYSVLAVGMLVGIYFFVTFEESALATAPPAEHAAVFAPLTPTPLPTPLPTPTPAPTPTPLPTLPPDVKLTWADGPADIFAAECAACHGGAARLGGLDLSSYQGLMSGGASGPVVAPGDPAASRLVTLIESGSHPGQLSGSELERIRQWIADGALEK